MRQGKDKNTRSRSESPKRRPYERPRIVSEEKLEVVAAVCDPASGGKGDPITCPSFLQS
jgi:hypothetical protein